MKESYRIMAGILLAGLIFAALYSVLSALSFSDRLGEHMDVPEECYKDYADSGEIKKICSRKSPEIIRQTSKIWKPGEEIQITQVFEGRDAEGIQTEIKVLDIQDEHGNDRMDCYDRAAHKMVFSERGMYLLELKTTDGQRKSAVRKFVLLTDYRQGGI